jgi:hypothetical protein
VIIGHRPPIITSSSNQASGNTGPPLSPSFLIGPARSIDGNQTAGRQADRNADVSAAHWAVTPLRLDRINSRELLGSARQVYHAFLSTGPTGVEPAGVVMVGESRQGRVVFDLPVLLPQEQFVPIDWLRGRSQTRSRSPRGGSPRWTS